MDSSATRNKKSDDVVYPGQGIARHYFFTFFSGVACAVATTGSFICKSRVANAFFVGIWANAVAVMIVSQFLLQCNFKLLRAHPSGYDLVEKKSTTTSVPAEKIMSAAASHTWYHLLPGLISLSSLSRMGRLKKLPYLHSVIVSATASAFLFMIWASVPCETADGYIVVAHDKIKYLYRSPSMKICSLGPLTSILMLLAANH